jgi:hypothetical protein
MNGDHNMSSRTTDYVDYEVLETTSGWVVFSGVVILVGAFVNLIFGITALANPDWIVITPEALIRFDLTTVGVSYLIFAAIQLFVGLGVFSGALWARVLGIIGASINALAQVAFLSLYPAWAGILLVIDALIIYGLTVHGDEIAEF